MGRATDSAYTGPTGLLAGERRIVGPDHHLRDYHRDLAPDPARHERVMERLRQEIADLALGLGAQDVERRQGHDGRRHLRRDGKEANLRAVAVRQDDLGTAPLREVDERPGGDLQVGPLDLGRPRLAPADQRISAQGDRDPRHPRRSPRWSPLMSA